LWIDLVAGHVHIFNMKIGGVWLISGIAPGFFRVKVQERSPVLLMRILLSSIFVLLMSGFTAVQGQHNFDLYNLGDQIYVSPGAIVTVQGDVHMQGGTFSNSGLVEVQGNLYSDNTFQQNGTGILRMENNDVNVADTQFVSGSWAVRGGQSQIGTDDGSFYNLELANTQGIVYLIGDGNVADVRNQVDFAPSAASGTPPLNRIVTHDIGIGVPANGSNYSAVFGMMNPSDGLAPLINNTVSSNGNSSGVDAGYVQGRFRRAIAPTGGQYSFVLGLEPAGAGAQRGMQYTRLDFGANNYDVVEGYFETASPNVLVGPQSECGYLINYFGGTDHGEWNFEDIGTGAGNYEVWVWPQDDNFPPQSVWFITKDDSIQGTLGQCGPSPVGLNRSAFNGFSEFGVAASTVIFPVTLTSLGAIPIDNRYIQVRWTTMTEENFDHFVIERSRDNLNFTYLDEKTAAGHSSSLLSYDFDDFDVIPEVDYFYRLKSVDIDGSFSYSESVQARLLPSSSAPEILVYPNPISIGSIAGGDLNVDVFVQAGSEVNLSIIDGRGRVVYESNLELISGKNHFQIPTSELAAGPYLLRLQGVGLAVARTFVVNY
jgi:hypothetical protein